MTQQGAALQSYNNELIKCEGPGDHYSSSSAMATQRGGGALPWEGAGPGGGSAVPPGPHARAARLKAPAFRGPARDRPSQGRTPG